MATRFKPGKAPLIARLRRIEGQVNGLIRMLNEDRYTLDVITQVSSVRGALGKVESEIVRYHVSQCVDDAVASSDPIQRQESVDELVEALGRLAR